MKNFKKLMCLCLISALAIFSFGEVTGGAQVNAVTSVITENGYTIWSATSAEKILKGDTGYASKGGAELTYTAVRNEYESAQLMLTTDANTQINTYYLKAADLKDAKGNVLSASNFDIYNEYYHYCDYAMIAQTYAYGYVPDALVPQSYAKEAGELKVDKASNQGLWVTVYIPKTAVAGVYSGNFILLVNNKTYNIPVSVNVKDYTICDEEHTSTYFAVWDDSLMGSELDCTKEMKTRYFEYLLDYRIISSLPMESLDPAEVISVVDKYYDEPLMNYYVIPCFNWGVSGNGLSLPNLKSNILAIASASTKDRNLLSKGMLYYMDEIDGTIGFQAGLNNFNAVDNMLKEVVAEIDNDSTGKYTAFKQIANWKNVILNIPTLLTAETDKTPDWVYERADIMCPAWARKSSWSEFTKGKIEEYGTEWWWYGCVGPSAPSPTYHLNDQNLLSSRFINWLNYDFHINGILYWATASAGDSFSCSTYRWGTELEDLGDDWCNQGDGYLLYAGAKYGHGGPIPSIRLMSVRDGLEEYELIYALNDYYVSKGSAQNAYNQLCNMWASMHDGTIIKNDVPQFMALRNNLIETLISTTNPHGFFVTDISVEGNNARVEMTLNEGYTLKVNGNILNKTNGKYYYDLNLNTSNSIDVVITKGSENYSFRQFISDKVIVLNGFNTEADINRVSVTTNSTVSYVSSGEYAGSAYAEVKSVFTGNAFTDLYFEPSIKFDLTAGLGSYKFSDLNKISIKLWNRSGSKISFDVYINSGTANLYVDSVTLNANEDLMNYGLSLNTLSWNKLDSVDSISFVFKNDGNADSPKVYKFNVDNVYGYTEG